MVIPLDAVIKLLGIQTCSNSAIWFPCIGERRDPIRWFVNLADCFKVFQAVQLSFHMWSHCYWALPWRVYDGPCVRFECDVVLPFEASNSLKAVWKLPLKVGCVLDQWKFLCCCPLLRGAVLSCTAQFIVTTPSLWDDGRPRIAGPWVSATYHLVRNSRGFSLRGFHRVQVSRAPCCGIRVPL